MSRNPEPRGRVDVLVADSVTKLGPPHRGQVLIAASHGGVYAGYLAALAHVRGVVLNDAGVGLDGAGIGALPYLAGLGVPAAAIGHMSARIGDGADMAGRGVVTHVNDPAARFGCAPGDTAMACAWKMGRAEMSSIEPPEYTEARQRLGDAGATPPVWAIDSAALIAPDDADSVVITGSHGALLGGRAEMALRHPALAATFNDAGVGIDGAGITRLPVLEARGIAAVTVAADSARIGDARSSFETGRISHANPRAVGLGAEMGLALKEFVTRLVSSPRPAKEGAA